jgi:hypothetical protein
MNQPNSFISDHALAAEHFVIAGECPSSLDELRASLCAEHQPASTTESMLVNEIAEQFWRLLRMRAAEARGTQEDMIHSLFETGMLALIARGMSTAERGLHRAITMLRKLQAYRGFVPAKSPAPTASREPDAVLRSSADSPVSAAALRQILDFGDLDVDKFLANYAEDLHPIVLRDLAGFEAERKRSRHQP